MNEHQFVRSVHKTLKDRGGIYVWKIQAASNNGVPDAYYSATSDLWCEYKSVPSGRKIGISDLQRRWLDARHREGRNVMLAVLTRYGVRVYTTAPFPKSLEDGYESYCAPIPEFKQRLIDFLVT